jgi:hypothetical protein
MSQAIALAIMAIASVASAGYSVYQATQGSPSVPDLQLPTMTKTQDTKTGLTAEEKAAEETKRRASAASSGSLSTILTGGQNLGTANVARKTLLGQ